MKCLNEKAVGFLTALKYIKQGQIHLSVLNTIRIWKKQRTNYQKVFFTNIHYYTRVWT